MKINIEATCWGNWFHLNLPVSALEELSDALTARIKLIQALGSPQVTVFATFGEEQTSDRDPQVSIAVYGLPRQPVPGSIVFPGINDDVRRAVEENTKICIEQFWEKNQIPGAPKHDVTYMD